MHLLYHVCLFLLGLSPLCLAAAATSRSLSGIHPHLAMFNDEDECGTGAVVPWANRLWVVTYAPHKPLGSTDKLYELTPDLEQIIRPESIGGTPANRMIHRESQQLFIGPYVIDARGTVRVIPYPQMFGRPTGNARHLTDPARLIYYASMEEGIYEVDVHTLKVTELWADEYFSPRPPGPGTPRRDARFADFPGYHGKGFYSGQGRLIYANNGEHGAEAQRRPDVPSGVLAQWDGRAGAWTIVRRNQFTEVTGPGGLHGNPHPATDPVWTIGWDHRSLILMVLDGGRWHAYRLPKASHAYDGAHGWNTEWPRIRDIGEDALLMTMHGSFWRFPRAFSATHSAGVAPRSTYLKVIGDFCRWGDEIVLGCDDSARSEFLNRHPLKGEIAGPGRSQSNLWFVEPERLDRLGPALGRGAVWLGDEVRVGEPSEPFLFAGYARRSLHLQHGNLVPVTFTLEVDRRGDGAWSSLRDVAVPPRQAVLVEFTAADAGAWVRLTAQRDATEVTAFFHYRALDHRGSEASAIFDGIAQPSDTNVSGGLLHVRGGDSKTLRFLARNGVGEVGCYDLDGDLLLRRTEDPAGTAWTAKAVALPPALIRLEDGAALYVDAQGTRWRLPRGDVAIEEPGPLGDGRVCREVCTERNLLNVAGTFYELPAENAGGFARLRPIATHNRHISDFASYRGLLILSGITADARGPHIIRSEDGRCALWAGAVDDLWAFGKPRGTLGIWRATPVRAGEPSDACLVSGFDRKRLVLSPASSTPATCRVEADVAGTGAWTEVLRLTAPIEGVLEHVFPEGFGAYWLRLVCDRDATMTATLVYD